MSNFNFFYFNIRHNPSDAVFNIGGDNNSLLIKHSFNIKMHACFNKFRNYANIQTSLSYEDIEKVKQVKGTILIVDDLCDAGGTFIAAAKYLKETLENLKH